MILILLLQVYFGCNYFDSMGPIITYFHYCPTQMIELKQWVEMLKFIISLVTSNANAWIGYPVLWSRVVLNGERWIETEHRDSIYLLYRTGYSKLKIPCSTIMMPIIRMVILRLVIWPFLACNCMKEVVSMVLLVLSSHGHNWKSHILAATAFGIQIASPFSCFLLEEVPWLRVCILI